jgi:hypothetical protein
MNRQNILHVSRYDSKKLFVMFLVAMIALIIDIGISNIADILSKQAVTFWGVTLFVIIAVIYVLGQYFILGLVKAKNEETDTRRRFLNIASKTVTIVQYFLTAIMMFVVLQIIITSQFYTNLLSAATTVSYGLAICCNEYPCISSFFLV